ncbi:uncharacterized protein LOC108103838 [Drosophila eugracilis]|uniref:uncharacterized protein LOC108103838 n=1 Tax=Drosophila eugracilis TaxID=29029 RepID=UPI0007E6FD8D|nr:uncharacterized protein LOC108103838 [Drosophila eugracilis]
MAKYKKVKPRKMDVVFHNDCEPDVIELDDLIGEEEFEEETPRTEEIHWENMKREIGAMNRSLDEMQASLDVDPYEKIMKIEVLKDEAEADKVGLEPEDSRWMVLNGSRDPVVRDLQWNNLRIRRQLDALARCSELGNGRILALDRLFSRQHVDLVACRQVHDQVESFHLTKQLEAGKCLQRFRHAQELYASWRELFRMGRDLREAYKKILERTQSRLHYVEYKRRAYKEITSTNETCLGAIRELLMRVRVMEMGLAPLGITRSSANSRRQGSLNSTNGHSDQRPDDTSGRPVVVRANVWQRRSFRTVKFSRGDLLNLPIVIPPVSKTWYGKMQYMLYNPIKTF